MINFMKIPKSRFIHIKLHENEKTRQCNQHYKLQKFEHVFAQMIDLVNDDHLRQIIPS